MMARSRPGAAGAGSVTTRSAVSGPQRWRRACLALSAVAALQALSGCVGLVVGGAVVGGMVAVDRRTSGAQVEDQGIELKAISRIREVTGGRGHASVTSYNRVVLVTGEAATEEDKQAIDQAIQRIENVRSIVNELAVMEPSSLGSRSSDLVVTSKVKAALIDAADLQASAYKVVTERGVVHLMGRVTQREADRGAEVARAVGGVKRVVRVFEVITEAELAKLQTQPPATPQQK